MLKPNRFGRYKKDEILNNGYRILKKEDEGCYTATEIYEMLGVIIKPEQRLVLCKGFVCKREWRGCVPVFDFNTIFEMKKNNEI